MNEGFKGVVLVRVGARSEDGNETGSHSIELGSVRS